MAMRRRHQAKKVLRVGVVEVMRQNWRMMDTGMETAVAREKLVSVTDKGIDASRSRWR